MNRVWIGAVLLLCLLASNAAFADTAATLKDRFEGACTIPFLDDTDLHVTFKDGTVEMVLEDTTRSGGVYDLSKARDGQIPITTTEGTTNVVELLDNGHIAVLNNALDISTICKKMTPKPLENATARKRFAESIVGTWGSPASLVKLDATTFEITAEGAVHTGTYTVVGVSERGHIGMIELETDSTKAKVLVGMDDTLETFKVVFISRKYSGLEQRLGRLGPLPGTDLKALDAAFAAFQGTCQANDDLVPEKDGPATLTIKGKTFTVKDQVKGQLTPVRTTPQGGITVAYTTEGEIISHGLAELTWLDEGSLEIDFVLERSTSLVRSVRRCVHENHATKKPSAANTANRNDLEARIQGDWLLHEAFGSREIRLRFRNGTLQMHGFDGRVSHGTYTVDAARENALWIVTKLDGKTENISGYNRIELSDNDAFLNLNGMGDTRWKRAPALPTADVQACPNIAKGPYVSVPKLCAKGTATEIPGAVEPYPVKIELTTKDCPLNTSCGSVTYGPVKTPTCQGELHYLGGDSSTQRYCFREVMPEDSACISGGIVMVRKEGDAWRWLWDDLDGATGVSAWSDLEVCP